MNKQNEEEKEKEGDKENEENEENEEEKKAEGKHEDESESKSGKEPSENSVEEQSNTSGMKNQSQEKKSQTRLVRRTDTTIIFLNPDDIKDEPTNHNVDEEKALAEVRAYYEEMGQNLPTPRIYPILCEKEEEIEKEEGVVRISCHEQSEAFQILEAIENHPENYSNLRILDLSCKHLVIVIVIVIQLEHDIFKNP